MSQKPAKHAKVEVLKKITQEEFDNALAEDYKEFDSWRQSILSILDTQRKNLYRADSLAMTFSNVLESPLAMLVAHHRSEEDSRANPMSNLWAFNFTKQVQKHIDEDLEKLEEIFSSLGDIKELLDLGNGKKEDAIFKMIPYVKKDEITIEDVFWGDLTYQTIRPYGEKLNDAVRQFAEQKKELDARLELGSDKQ